MSRRIAPGLLVSLLIAAIVPAAAQSTYPIKKCDAPKEPLGVLHGQGQVTYRLNRDGKVDTASLRIVSLRGISAASLRSAAVRLLAVCRFDRSADAATGDVVVVDAVGFDSATTIVTPATAVPESIATIAVAARPALPADPIDATDSTVEERPRRLGCDHLADVPPFMGSWRTRQDADAALAAWKRQNSGVLMARVTVTAEGGIERDGITVTSSTNPAMMDEFIRVLMSCRYVPGRVAGIPVPTIVATRTAIGLPSGVP